jgi:hypothetical protein
VLLITEFNLLKKFYIVAFHQSGIIGHSDRKGEFDGEVDSYLNGWRIDYYANGVIKNKYYFKNGKIDGVAYTYYPDKKIEDQTTYKEGKFDGSKTRYFENGKVENKSFRKNDKVEGAEHGYYEDGILKYSRYWVNNNPYGDLYYYYDRLNEKVKFYHAYDVLGNKFYLNRYDASRSEGYVFSNNIYSKENDSSIVLKDNNKYRFINDLFITVANPPHATTEIRVVINGKLCKNLMLVDNNNTVKISNAFLSKGIYNIVIDGVFLDSLKRITNSLTDKTTIIKD